MRLIPLAALACLANPSASPAARHAPSPRPIVVIVHGRGHLEGDSAALRRDWTRDLDASLKAVGLPPLDDEDVRLAWYADLLDPARAATCEPARASSDSLSAGEFIRDLLVQLVSTLPQNESRETRDLVGDLLYAMDPARRCAVGQRVGGVLERIASEGRPTIVLAYSLGSLVTYAWLDAQGRSASHSANRDLRLVTIGSPLGNRDVRDLLGLGSDSLRMPDSVRSWENVYNSADVFASQVGRALPDVRDVETSLAQDGDPHELSRYLRDPATGAAVGRAYCLASASDSPACMRLLKPAA